MPNHVATKLTLTGDFDSISALLLNSQKHENENKIDFNVLFPLPPELREISSPVTIVSEDEEIRDKIRYESEAKDKVYRFGRKISQKTPDEFIAKFGSNNWYDWALNNWGTKWGIYDLQVGENYTFFYNTAWSPATEFWRHVSESYPDVIFTHEFADGGGGFVGYESIQNGEIIDSLDCEWDSSGGIEIRENVGYYYPEDEEMKN